MARPGRSNGQGDQNATNTQRSSREASQVSLEELDKSVNMLGNHLAQVLVTDAPPPTGTPSTPQPALCELAQQVDQIRGLVQSFLNSLEV